MKIFKVDFEGMYPVPHGLIIAAESIEEAGIMAEGTTMSLEIHSIEEIDISKPTIVFFESGDY